MKQNREMQTQESTSMKAGQGLELLYKQINLEQTKFNIY